MISEEISDSVSQQHPLKHTASLSPNQKSEIRNQKFSFSIPPTDRPLTSRLPEPARKKLDLTLLALRRINLLATGGASTQTLSLNRACDIVAREQQNKRGFTAATLRRLYYAYRERGDWTVLVDKALAGPAWWKTDEAIGLPPAFVDFWRKLCEENQRKCKPAHRELLQIWRTGCDTRKRTYTEIPGYDGLSFPGSKSEIRNPQSEIRNQKSEIPLDPFTNVPRGWSYDNLQRLAPDPFELAAARQGRFAASFHRRQVFTTRVGLQIAQFVFFDDHEYNKKVVFTGNGQAQRRATRPLGFNALDLASACLFANLFKPTLIDDETERKQKLRQNEMVWFVADVLCGTGYNIETGTTFIVEHGTAAISEELERRIFDLTGGKIIVDRSGRFGRASHPGLFEGANIRGNPRFKAPLESLYNLIDNELAGLPGQTGKDRNHAPDEMVGREKYAVQLLRVLTPDMISKARFPFLTWHEWVAIATEVFHRINLRGYLPGTSHDLEGWEKCGYSLKEWRITPTAPWMSMDEFKALPAPQQMSLTELFNTPSGSALVRSRKLSPQEVFSRGAKALHRLPLLAVPQLLGPGFATERTVRGGYITLEDQAIDTEPLRFPAYPDAASGSRGVCLRNGDKCLTYLMAANQQSEIRNQKSAGPVLIVCDAQNRYLAELTLQPTPSRADVAAVTRQIAAAKKEEAQRLAPVQARHLDEARARARMHQHNATLLQGQPVTPEDLQRAHDLHQQSEQADTADILDTGGASFHRAPKSEIKNQKSEIPTQATAEDIADLLS